MCTSKWMLLIISIAHRTIIGYADCIAFEKFSFKGFVGSPTLELALISASVVKPVKPLFESDAPIKGIFPLVGQGGFLL